MFKLETGVWNAFSISTFRFSAFHGVLLIRLLRRYFTCIIRHVSIEEGKTNQNEPLANLKMGVHFGAEFHHQFSGRIFHRDLWKKKMDTGLRV